MKLSIVVPCYNEEKNIPLVLEKFQSVIKRDDVEVILVNNGSKDNSQLVLNELIPKYSFARTVLVEVNQGYGFGILSGLKEAKGDYIGWTHADMQTDPYD
ncbi:MAG TPA: glycosyltransferase family 2 protein, partial [Leptospiraceae bacterium]|nr:glycosyltransferase family 2 protein [Leptospiraceae bacterium]